jgi:hypothetical protein
MTNSSHPPDGQARAELTKYAASKSTSELGYTLEFLDQLEEFKRVFLQEPGGLGTNERLTREVILDTLCQRHPEIAAAYQAWKQDAASTEKIGDIVAAAIRSLGPRYTYMDNGEVVCGTLAEYAVAWQHAQAITGPHATLSAELTTQDGHRVAVEIDELDGYDNGITSGVVYRFTAGDDVIEHHVPDTPTATIDAAGATDAGNNEPDERVLIAHLDESFTYFDTGERVHATRDVRLRIVSPTVCDHDNGTICTECAPSWQLDHEFDDPFPFPRTRRVTIRELLDTGQLEPGQTLTMPDSSLSAVITGEGLMLPDGRVFDNPSAAANAIMNSSPTPPRMSLGGLITPDEPPIGALPGRSPVGLPEAPSVSWHVERLSHDPACPDRDRVVVVAIDASDAEQAERRTLDWARHPSSPLSAHIDDFTAKAIDRIGPHRWTVALAPKSDRR